MSVTLFMTRSHPRSGGRRAATAVAASGQLGGLALALSGAGAPAAIAVASAGAAVGAWVLAPQALKALRRRTTLLSVLALGLVAVLWMRAGWYATHPGRAPIGYGSLLVPMRFMRAGPLAWPWRIGRVPLLGTAVVLIAASGGLVLISDAVRIWLGLAPRQRAPWRALTAVSEKPPRIAPRAVAGAILVAWAAVPTIGWLSPPWYSDAPWHALLLLTAYVMTTALLVGPVAVGALMRVDLDKAGTARERERQRFAAHLHDSVLQTLALVQRQANDPAAVVRLARRQEHALRAWMAGESDLVSETLVAALREVVEGVEDEHEITIELTAIGDRPLDPAGEALVAAAREALRNAARHAAGARVVVYASVADSGVEVFVRDDGPGFETGSVAPERRGICDAIVGRMAAAGGSATVESAVGEGTEVALRLTR
jgi:signal transduction histidine kinase